MQTSLKLNNKGIFLKLHSSKKTTKKEQIILLFFIIIYHPLNCLNCIFLGPY